MRKYPYSVVMNIRIGPYLELVKLCAVVAWTGRLVTLCHPQ